MSGWLTEKGNQRGAMLYIDREHAVPLAENEYNIVAKYNRHEYPANPNGSDYDVAALASKDGRHLAIMPHPERTQFPWQCGFYPEERRTTDRGQLR